MKAFKDALKSFKRKALIPTIKLRNQVRETVFAKELEELRSLDLESKQGLVRRAVRVVRTPGLETPDGIDVVNEPGVAISVKGDGEIKEALKPQTALRDLLHLGRPSNIDHLLRHPGSFTGGVPRGFDRGFEIRDGVLKTESFGCNCKERSAELGLPGLQCVLCTPSAARQEMHNGTIHVKGIFAQGETARRILTGVELDGKEGVVEEPVDIEVAGLAIALRNGRYIADSTEVPLTPRYDNRNTMAAIHAIANAVSCKETLSFALKFPDGYDGSDEFLIKVTAPYLPMGGALGADLNMISNDIRHVGYVPNSIIGKNSFSPGFIAFATAMAHTLNEEGTHYKYSLVKVLHEKVRLEHEADVLEKFKESLRNIATMLEYGDDLNFEVIGKPMLGLTGYRAKVEFISDQPCLRMFEALQPAIFQGEWIDFNEVGRIEQKLINKKEDEKLAQQKTIPNTTRLSNAFDDPNQVVPDDFVKPDAFVRDVPLTISPKVLVEARWKHIHGVKEKALKAMLDGAFPESAIIGEIEFAIHESTLAMKHREKDAKVVQFPLAYEAAYMMFAEELLEEILNRPHFPFPVKAFIQHSHPLSHNLGVVSAVLPILSEIAKKKGRIHLVSRELFEHPVLK